MGCHVSVLGQEKLEAEARVVLVGESGNKSVDTPEPWLHCCHLVVNTPTKDRF